MKQRSQTGRVRAAALILAALLSAEAPARASGAPQGAPPAAPDSTGTSLAEKIACAYLFVGGAIMVYYGPQEKENGQLTRDGKSEAIGGAAAIGLSVALLRDIVKKRARRHQP